MPQGDIILYDYWRSSAAYRVRIALNLKSIPYESRVVDIKPGADEQQGADYTAINAQQRVPSLQVGDQVFNQSMAILEWLEEKYPSPRLLPEDPDARLKCRAFADTIACDVHPLNNLSVLKALREDFDAEDAQIRHWYHDWIHRGFRALETAVPSGNGEKFLFGETPGLAEITLVPQVHNAQRYEMDLSAYPRLMNVAAACATVPAFIAAAPDAVKP